MCLHVGSVGIQGGTVRDYFISVFQDWSLIDVNIAEQFIDFASNGADKFYIFSTDLVIRRNFGFFYFFFLCLPFLFLNDFDARIEQYFILTG